MRYQTNEEAIAEGAYQDWLYPKRCNKCHRPLKTAGNGTCECGGLIERAPDPRPIHWTGTPPGVCERMDSGADVLVERYQTKSGDFGTIASSSKAFHEENVTCPVCATVGNLKCEVFDEGND